MKSCSASRHTAHARPATAPLSRSRSVRVCANTEGVQDLLARDRKRKQVELAPELQDPVPQLPGREDADAAEDDAAAGSGKGRRAGRFKSRSQRRRDMAANEAAAGSSG